MTTRTLNSASQDLVSHLQEIIFALSQGLNLDNIETAYVILNGD